MAVGLKLAAMLVPLSVLGFYAMAEQSKGVDRKGMRLVFHDEFDRAPSFYDPVTAPGGRWKTNFFFGVQDPDHPIGWGSRTLEPNHELQYYAPPSGIGAAPFETANGVLSIVARPNPAPGDARTHGLPYISGLISTEKSFSARTGYFEARIAMPPGRGLWPAFWLLPVPQTRDGNPVEPGKQEIDVVEAIGEPGRIHHTIFSDRNGEKVKDAAPYDTHADLTAFHTYGVRVTNAEVTWYFDDHEVRRVPNVDFHRPAYMLLNLAVGGDWPGAPDKATVFPARMKIDWVRVYALP